MVDAENALKEILPVFAGMIPTVVDGGPSAGDSPRIRGDDPADDPRQVDAMLFSPYSRG